MARDAVHSSFSSEMVAMPTLDYFIKYKNDKRKYIAYLKNYILILQTHFIR